MTLTRSDAEKVIALFEEHLKNGYYLKTEVERTHF
jgi:hypothetical protein